MAPCTWTMALLLPLLVLPPTFQPLPPPLLLAMPPLLLPAPLLLLLPPLLPLLLLPLLPALPEWCHGTALHIRT